MLGRALVQAWQARSAACVATPSFCCSPSACLALSCRPCTWQSYIILGVGGLVSHVGAQSQPHSGLRVRHKDGPPYDATSQLAAESRCPWQ